MTRVHRLRCEHRCARRRLGAGTAAAQVMPFVRALTAADAGSSAAALAPSRWYSLRDNRLVSSEAAAFPQLGTLSLADEPGSDDSEDAESLYDRIED